MKSKDINLNTLIFILFFILLVFPKKVCTQGITSETISPSSLNRLVSGIHKKNNELSQRNLIGEQKPLIHGKCATPIVMMALAHPDWLDEENRFILFRPTDSWDDDYYGNVAVWYYDTPEGHFRLHYTENNINNGAVFGSDGIQSTIPDYVILFGSYFEQAWEYETDPTKFGYTSPPPDGIMGGDDRFDIYITNTNYYGYTALDNGHPYIVVHNNYTDFESNLDPEGTRYGNMKITAAHEFFHAIQYFYDDWNNDCIWWEENTAVWMEDEVFDYVDGYLNYLGNPFDDLNGNLRWDSGEDWYYYDGNQGGTIDRENDVWFEAPHIPLDTRYTSVFTRYEYGGVMWAKYLAAMFGNEFIKDTFIITDYNTDALTAIQQTLMDYGSNLEDAFSDFRVKVLTLDFFEEGGKYPLIKHIGNYGDYPKSLGPENPIDGDKDTLGDISPLSSRYIGFKAPFGEKKLVIDVDGQDFSNFTFSLVLFKDNGYEIQYLPFDDWDKQIGRIEILSFGTNGLYKSATLIPMNLSTYQDNRSVYIYAQLKAIIQYTLRLKGGINLVSLPTNLPGASTSFDFLENYFDPNMSLQFLGYDTNKHEWQISYIENQLKGTSFPIEWQKSYIISVLEDLTVDLSGDPPAQTTIDLIPGRNFISSLISNAETLSPKLVLNSTNSDSGERISASIQKYDYEKGKRRCGYWFFGRFTGEDFVVEEGEGYMIDMFEGRQGWSPSSI